MTDEKRPKLVASEVELALLDLILTLSTSIGTLNKVVDALISETPHDGPRAFMKGIYEDHKKRQLMFMTDAKALIGRLSGESDKDAG